jgi:hypothetical protein
LFQVALAPTRELGIQVSQRRLQHIAVVWVRGSFQLLNNPLPREKNRLLPALCFKLLWSLARFPGGGVVERFRLLFFDGLALPASGHGSHYRQPSRPWRKSDQGGRDAVRAAVSQNESYLVTKNEQEEKSIARKASPPDNVAFSSYVVFCLGFRWEVWVRGRIPEGD